MPQMALKRLKWEDYAKPVTLCPPNTTLSFRMHLAGTGQTGLTQSQS